MSDGHGTSDRNPEIEWLMAIAGMLLAILEPDRDAKNLGQPLLIPAVVCPGCSTAHWDSKTLCDTCASEGPA